MICALRRGLQRCVLPVLAAVLCGCSSIVHKPLAASAPGEHKIAVFFDGTHNEIASDTNIKRLHSLVSLRSARDISSIYIEGVGTGSDVIGAGTGYGMAPRVRIGYEFILNHYRPNDKIYIFGFSRGAYAARILASILHNAGVVTKEGMPNAEVAEVVYQEFKYSLAEADEHTRQGNVTAALKGKGFAGAGAVSVEVLGLWDTVEAMGIPDWDSRLRHKAGIRQHHADIDTPNMRYGDQLCNVKRAYQALSIDDNREWIFTPLPLDRRHLFRHCAGDDRHLLDRNGKIKPGALREVWFSGAHSDVGGGYDDSLLSGVSLNWMIENLKDTGLLPAGAGVAEDPFGTSHDPEAGWWRPLYHAMKRDIGSYMTDKDGRRGEFGNRLCIHSSVPLRRNALPRMDRDNHLLSLLRPGKVGLVPDTPETFGGWVPPLREAKAGEAPGNPPLELEIQVWPDCEMKR